MLQTSSVVYSVKVVVCWMLLYRPAIRTAAPLLNTYKDPPPLCSFSLESQPFLLAVLDQSGGRFQELRV